MRKAYNILIGEFLLGEDKPLFFGDENGLRVEDVFLHMPDGITYSKLLHHLGIFKSKSEASRAGWNRPIPEGFSYHEIGKFKTPVVILKGTIRTREYDELLAEGYTPLKTQ